MDVFVYGSLTDPECVGDIVESYAFLGSAVLSGLHPVQGEYPTLAPGGETGGRLLRTDDVGALDAYEGVDDGLYVRVPVPVERAESWSADGEQAPGLDDAVGVYVGDPARLGVGAEVTWPDADGESPDGGSEPTDGDDFAGRVRAYVQRHAVRVRPQ